MCVNAIPEHWNVTEVQTTLSVRCPSCTDVNFGPLCLAGIVMFAVGVGKAVESELREIASEPVDQHFSYSADFNTMTNIVENLKLNICPGK